ncbi:hypothetical protein EDD17DRAFT_1616602 [Pisolithus thermaeus]|nr:hypothetical protein EDD17DRAFT_1616602 [Pisolithus thermaeus]
MSGIVSRPSFYCGSRVVDKLFESSLRTQMQNADRVCHRFTLLAMICLYIVLPKNCNCQRQAWKHHHSYVGSLDSLLARYGTVSFSILAYEQEHSHFSSEKSFHEQRFHAIQVFDRTGPMGGNFCSRQKVRINVLWQGSSAIDQDATWSTRSLGSSFDLTNGVGLEDLAEFDPTIPVRHAWNSVDLLGNVA